MIQVIVDDLAFLAVDAVLRPADQSLAPVTPAMVRLDQQAGAHFAALRRVARPLDAGAAVVTGGGELAAPFVVHVVVQDERGGVVREVVRRALISAWQRAAEWQLERLAAPVIGVGAGRLSLEDAARLMAETYAARAPGSAPRELQIVVERAEDQALVTAVVQRIAV